MFIYRCANNSEKQLDFIVFHYAFNFILAYNSYMHIYKDHILFHIYVN